MTLVDVTVIDEVVVVTLNRPEKLNALTGAMRRDLAAALREHGAGTARGIVLTGAGRAFCAGEDLNEAAAQPPGGLIDEVETFHDLTRAILESTVPVIAAVNGLAVGGGAEVTLCCDARLGAPGAGFYLPENTLGLTISNASSFLLPRLIGVAAAYRLVLESPRLDATAALELGLLDEIVDDPVGSAVALARRWTGPGTATAAHLRLLRPPVDLIEAAFARETQAARSVDETGIAKAGVDRFHAARIPGTPDGS